MRISIDTEKCQGHGRCYALAPALFTCDDDGFGVVRSAEVDLAEVQAARHAAGACPEQAIELFDGD